ncbi:hypothetical protein A3K73_01550 [Candidatus Pacearchaeota archaeon RBG_13_36_9]|nr:MAG: hypothetical protein A3K73_01550 [Candidatus Pacearchaeota archaeon RBG_13_36_9]
MGYYKEKKNYEKERTKTIVNKCPECKKGNLVVETITSGGFRSKTVFKSFCPVCGYTIKREV